MGVGKLAISNRIVQQCAHIAVRLSIWRIIVIERGRSRVTIGGKATIDGAVMGRIEGQGVMEEAIEMITHHNVAFVEQGPTV